MEHREGHDIVSGTDEQDQLRSNPTLPPRRESAPTQLHPDIRLYMSDEHAHETSRSRARSSMTRDLLGGNVPTTTTTSHNASAHNLSATSPHHSSPLRQRFDDASIASPQPIHSALTSESTERLIPHTSTRRPAPPPLQPAPAAFQPAAQSHQHKFARRKRQRRAYTRKVDWKNKWKSSNFKKGRVLIIDYLSHEHLKNGRPITATQELCDLDSLEKCYADRERTKQAALRVVHVQNATWAMRFLLNSYNIEAHKDPHGLTFGQWAKFEKPEWRAGRPLLKGRVWRLQKDPWRRIQRSSFGMDYPKHYIAGTGPTTDELKMMELRSYDGREGAGNGYNVYAQRCSVYVQLHDQNAVPPPDLPNPYDAKTDKSQIDRYDYEESADPACYKPHKLAKVPPLDSLANGSTIIIFDNSQTGHAKDTLIAARDQVEARWRHLTFWQPPEDISTDERLAFVCTSVILRDVFRTMSRQWEEFINVAEAHMGILEDKIYEAPADETRAPELWTNSKMWLRVEKLMSVHVNVVQDWLERLKELTEDVWDGAASEDQSIVPGSPTRAGARAGPMAPPRWLDGVPEEFNKLSNMIQESLVKPTANLNDLMYKSVGIRDSRHSLSLNDSMWRLSWITFVFLPLTFLSGFFGMNVDIFKNDPSAKWYFIAGVPLMLLVLVTLFLFKRAVSKWWERPYQRGVYEHLFHDLAAEHPEAWSRTGPRKYVEPEGIVARMKWRLLQSWYDPSKTIAVASDPDQNMGGSGLGFWGRMKRGLARRWLRTLKATRRPSISAAELAANGDISAATEMLALVTNIAAVEGEPEAAKITAENLERLNVPMMEQRTARLSALHWGGRPPILNPDAADSDADKKSPDSTTSSNGMIWEEQAIEDDAASSELAATDNDEGKVSAGTARGRLAELNRGRGRGTSSSAGSPDGRVRRHRRRSDSLPRRSLHEIEDLVERTGHELLPSSIRNSIDGIVHELTPSSK